MKKCRLASYASYAVKTLFQWPLHSHGRPGFARANCRDSYAEKDADFGMEYCLWLSDYLAI